MKKLIVIAALLFLPAIGQAAGLEVSPAEIRSPRSTLTIKNPTDQRLRFEVYADEHQREVKFSLTDFVLEPGQQREVTVEASRSTVVSVVARPDGLDQFQAAAGAKVPVSLDTSPIQASEQTDWITIGIYAGVFVGSMGLLRLMPKKEAV